MVFNTHYLQPKAENWQGRPNLPDHSCFFQIVKLLDLQHPPAAIAKNAFVLLGFRSDEGIKRNFGRVGSSKAPAVIREYLAKLACQKHDLHFYDAGDIICDDGDLESAQLVLAEALQKLLELHCVPIVIGGGHEVAFGHYQGIARAYPQKQLGIINFDAHIDMRPLLANHEGTSGSPFLQIAHAYKKLNTRFDYNCFGIQQMSNIAALFASAKKHHVNMIFAEDIQENLEDKCNYFIERLISQNDLLYISICLDVFAAAFAPGVSAPQAFGLAPWQVIPYLRQLASSGKALSYDLAELSPPFDIDGRTAKLAANLIYEIIHHHIPAMKR